MVPEFRMLVFSGIMDAFQRWLISTIISSSRRHKGNTHHLLDVNNDLLHKEACSVIAANLHIVNNERDSVLISAYHDIIRKATRTNDTNSPTTTTTTTTTTAMHLDQVVDINERLARMMLHILERQKDFAQKRLTVHIERDQLYRQLQYKISPLNPSSLHIINPDDVRQIGNGNTHDCCTEEQEHYKRNRCEWSSSGSFKRKTFSGQTKCYGGENNFHKRNFMIGTPNALGTPNFYTPQQLSSACTIF